MSVVHLVFQFQPSVFQFKILAETAQKLQIGRTMILALLAVAQGTIGHAQTLMDIRYPKRYIPHATFLLVFHKRQRMAEMAQRLGVFLMGKTDFTQRTIGTGQLEEVLVRGKEMYRMIGQPEGEDGVGGCLEQRVPMVVLAGQIAVGL